VIVTITVAVLVGYLAVTSRDIQRPTDRDAAPQMSPQMTPGRSGRNGY
jgi:hypothetical protein